MDLAEGAMGGHGLAGDPTTPRLFRVENRLVLIQDIHNGVAAVGQRKGHRSLTPRSFHCQVSLSDIDVSWTVPSGK